jgi:hypothetical protein
MTTGKLRGGVAKPGRTAGCLVSHNGRLMDAEQHMT